MWVGKGSTSHPRRHLDMPLQLLFLGHLAYQSDWQWTLLVFYLWLEHMVAISHQTKCVYLLLSKYMLLVDLHMLYGVSIDTHICHMCIIISSRANDFFPTYGASKSTTSLCFCFLYLTCLSRESLKFGSTYKTLDWIDHFRYRRFWISRHSLLVAWDIAGDQVYTSH